ASCQKELSETAAMTPLLPKDSITGNWKFIGLDIKSAIDVSTTITGIPASISIITDFLSKNNTGTLLIDSLNFNLSDFAYSVDTVSKITIFALGFPVSQDEPLQFDAPPYTNSARYQLVGADSIHFPNGDFINLPDDLMLPAITGVKYKRDGDKLIFNTPLSIDTVGDFDGISGEFSTRASLALTFQKQ
ncbi:MAG: hypothetical protein H7Y03_01945, partial [Chitinophagaceae bacterium]|nr:hypothetical protein [Chitinophagaceae bacterium]